MKLCDVNVLVYAHRPDSCVDHPRYAAWLTDMVNNPDPFGVSEAVLSGFIRVVTNARIFREPTPPSVALQFCQSLLDQPQALVLRPSAENWAIFAGLCRKLPARGKLVADAWHAALAIEHGCEWISTDKDFASFPKLRWRHPFAS